MVELLVMRHAKSSWDTYATDFDRPLNTRGVAAAQKMAWWLYDSDLCPDLIVSSAALRARSTIEPVIATCGIGQESVLVRRGLYHADVDRWMQELWVQSADRVLICGHNPGLDDLVIELLGTLPKLTRTGKLMTTATIAHLRSDADWHQLEPGSATLVDLERPRH